MIINITELHSTLRQQIIEANTTMAKYYNKTHLPTPADFDDGKKVYLSTRNLSTERPSTKLEARYVGPFTIIGRIGPNAGKLDPPNTMYNHPVFNINLLEPHTPNDIPKRIVPLPPPVIVQDQEEYIVSRKVDSKRLRENCYTR